MLGLFPDQVSIRSSPIWMDFRASKYLSSISVCPSHAHPAKLGYWLSAVGIARAFHLMISLPCECSSNRLSSTRVTTHPVFIKYFKPKPPIHLPSEPSEPLLNNSSSTSKPASPPPHKHHSPKFDLFLLRLSAAIEVIAYSSLIFLRTPQWWFIATILGAFGSGFGPALQSVALEVYTRRGETEAGKLFGALSVVNSLWYAFSICST